MLYMSWHPVDLLIDGEHLVFDFLDSDKPRSHRFIDQRCIGAPAERIAVVHLRMVKHLTLLFESFDDFLISVFNILPFILFHLFSETAIMINRTDDLYSFPCAGVKVTLTKSWSSIK